MKRLLLLLAICVITSCGQKSPQLNVFTWSEYLDPQLIAEFERQQGCRVTLDYFEDPEAMVAKLASGATAVYDIVVPSSGNLPALVKRGLLAPLRPEAIPNLRHIDPRFLGGAGDSVNRYEAPYLWGTTGIYVRNPAGAQTGPTWGLVFDPARQPGPFLLLDDPRSTIGAALRFHHASPNSTNTTDLQAVARTLADAKQRSLGFEVSVGGRNRVLAKGAAAAIVYSCDAVRGMEEDPETSYLIPQEGTEIWTDFLSIPSQAPHRELAEKFINFMLEPKTAARGATYTRSATANRTALQFVPEEDLKNPAIYPPPEVMEKLQYATDLGEAIRLYDDLWTQVKAR